MSSSISDRRKRGRPKGSKNKNKNKKQCQSDETERNFEAAFGHVDTHLPSQLSDSNSKLDEKIHFGMFGGGDSDGDDEALGTKSDDEERNVGFGSADVFDVQ